MHTMVKGNYSKFNPTKKNWYSKYSWTLKQEIKFEDWMVDYIYNNKEAKDELLDIHGKNKNLIRRAVRFFLLNYGWKIKR